jgi:prophage tail gpP-like protein
MKKSIIALSILLFTASFAVAFAQEPTAPKQAMMQTGEVIAVDATNNQIVIKGDADKEITLLIAADTKITKGGKAAVLADVKAGDLVTSECEDATGGCKARSIQVTGSKPKPKE